MKKKYVKPNIRIRLVESLPLAGSGEVPIVPTTTHRTTKAWAKGGGGFSDDDDYDE